jgi:EF hand
VFRLRVSPPELGAIMHLFDKDGDGTVNGAEFSKAFFKLGFTERTRRRKALLEHERLKTEQAQVKPLTVGHV